MHSIKNSHRRGKRRKLEHNPESGSAASVYLANVAEKQAPRVENAANQDKQATAWDSTVYRVKNIRRLNKSQLRQCLAQELGLGEIDVKIHSFVLDTTWKKEDLIWTATVSFKTKPKKQQFSTENGSKLVLDTIFDGFTPLTPGKQIDCIAIHGWGGGAMRLDLSGPKEARKCG
jgi:hypothetical protein